MKKYIFIILNSVIIFILASLSHFIYDIFPNDITAIFFPVNESIWEHMKLLYTPFLIDALIIYIYFTKKGIIFHNLLFSVVVSSIFAIFLYLIIYLPIYVYYKTNLIFDIILLFSVIVISQIINFKIIRKEAKQNINLSFVIIITICISIFFGYLTYKPVRNFIFYDFKHQKFGKNIYILGN